MDATLKADGLSFAYVAGVNVLEGVDLAVAPRSITGIVGPNGSGKTTLLKLLAGLLKPSRGSVIFGSKPLNAVNDRERARAIAYLPQQVQPIFNLTVFEVVCLGRFPHVGMLGGLSKRDVAVAESCLEQAGVAGLRHRDFLTLSGGERQRVLIASILAQEPKVLLLDEPTSSLDIHHQIEVLGLLKRLTQDDYGVAVVTHDLNLAARYCDSILLLSCDRGNALAHGAPQDVLTEALLTQAYGGIIRVDSHPVTNTPLVTAVDDPGRPS